MVLNVNAGVKLNVKNLCFFFKVAGSNPPRRINVVNYKQRMAKVLIFTTDIYLKTKDANKRVS